MKRVRRFSCQALVLLLILFLASPAGARPVTAAPAPYNPLHVNVLPEEFSKVLCPGQRIVLKYIVYYYVDFAANGPPQLIPANVGYPATVTLSATGGTVLPPQRPHVSRIGKVFMGDFSFTAGREPGQARVTITASMLGFETPFPLTFTIKPCKASLQFNQTMTYSYGVASVITTYSGSGSLKMDEHGEIRGSGTQAVWSDIPPYSVDGVSCVHSPPWEGSSAITFSGRMDDDGNAVVGMEMAALSVNSTTLTCSGDGGGGMAFPGYTYSDCQIQLEDFTFEAGTREVQFDCPGEAPYSVPITIIPRRGS